MGIIADTLQQSLDALAESDRKQQALTAETLEQISAIRSSIDVIDDVCSEWETRVANMLAHLRDEIGTGATHPALNALDILERFLLGSD